MTSKFALVIANTEYQDASFAKLTAPGKDAEEFAQVLRDTELAAFEDVQVLLNEGESKIRRATARFFADRKRDDLLLLYFSGHGIRNGQGQLFLAASDTEINILEATGIPADFITYAMNNSRSQRQLLILDCCNSGAFAHGAKGPSALGKSMGIATAFEGSGFGRVVLTATDATQFAWEGEKVIGDTQKSVFTHFLIEGLKGDADRNGDGRIDVDELYDYAYEQVVRRTPKQTPGKWSYRQQGDIVLRENLTPPDVKPSALPSDLLELLAHPNSGVRRAAIQDLISLLDGKHVGLARAAQDKLREIAENDDSLALRRTANDTLIARGIALEQPAPLEALKEGKKIEKPGAVLLPPEKSSRTDSPLPLSNVPNVVGKKVRTKTLRTPVGWRGIASKRNLRFAGIMITALLIVILGIILAPALKNNFSPGIGSTMTGKDRMILVYVPAGEFTMGSSNGASDQRPAHKVYLDAFWIDKTEVTNAMYAKCVQDGNCQPPDAYQSATRDSYYNNSAFGNYPVIYVSREAAKAYCEWANRRLPTEAEWEKAARGTDGRIYPWGNEAPSPNLLNYNNNVGDTTEVGKYPEGASPYGTLDMAGNVWEWVADRYDETYYASSPKSNPLGPDSGTDHVRRGGSWADVEGYVHSTDRRKDSTFSASKFIGFRCAASQNGQAGSTPPAQASSNTPSVALTAQIAKTDTPTPSQTSISPTPALGIGSTMTGKDGMTLLYVPAGKFTMGAINKDDLFTDDTPNEKPIHVVYLDAFWIDKTEITNAMYKKCVDDGSCSPPTSTKSHSRGSYYGNPEFADYPLIYVSWEAAKAYCLWAGRRLPTEAEWEKAARGDDERKYPWGNENPGANFLNKKYKVGDTAKVDQFPDGASPYGALDMAGNVWEWVADWYSDKYYASSPESDPLGPESGQYHVLRGGSWNDSFLFLDHTLNSQPVYLYYFITWRVKGEQNNGAFNIGFRCAMSATPQIRTPSF